MSTSIDVDCVFDSSCLIAFARVGRIDLLVATFASRSYSTPEVRMELEDCPEDRPGIAAVRPDEWLMWRQLNSIEELATYSETLRYVGMKGRGDAATIALAAHGGLTAVLDDGVARNRAASLGLPYVGTLGIIADFVVTGHLGIDEAWQLLQQMRSEEFRLKIDQAQFVAIIERRRLG